VVDFCEDIFYREPSLGARPKNEPKPARAGSEIRLRVARCIIRVRTRSFATNMMMKGDAPENAGESPAIEKPIRPNIVPGAELVWALTGGPNGRKAPVPRYRGSA